MDALWILLYGYFLTLCAVRTHADCTKPLGMESKWKGTKTYIHDSQITASSSMTTSNKGNGSRLARLNEKRTSIAGWCADPDDHHPFIKVDLLRIHTVTRIDTQGVVSYPAWVTEFKVEYSMDGVAWHEYKEDGKVKIFPGNINSMIPKKSLLKVPITARLIKLVLLKSSDDAFCLRMELYGCEPKEDCQTPVGLEDRRIKDNQITASTHWNEHYAYNARLHNKFSSSNDGVMWGGWCTDKKDTNQYLNIDLGHVRAVSGVATQGYITGSFVKNYKMNYSLDGQEWKMYTQNGVNKIFSGNWDNETVIRNWFARVFARYIRLNPVSWAPRGYICMRVEIYECSPTVGSVPIVSPPGASYKVNRTSSLNITCMIRGQENFAFIWMKNGFAIANTSTQIMQRKVFDNGTTLSTMTLRNIKYHDTGSVISCTAWYPGLSINTSRNVHVFVNAPRPKIKVTVLKSRDVTIAIMDPSPDDTSKYLIRYKINDDENVPWTIIERARPALRMSSTVYIKIKDLKPFTSYVTEVSSLYKDKDTGPYSVPLSFNTDEDVPSGPPRDVLVEPITDDHIIVSWSVPSYNKVNGRIVKYEVAYRSDNKKFKRLFTKQLQKEITGLRKEKNYEIIVRAYTRKGPGPFSKSIAYSTRTDVKPKSETTKALERLSKVTVTSQNAVKVTATVQNLTKTSDDNFIVDDVHMTATILNKVVSSNLSSAKVGDNLLKTISNVMNVNTETLHKTQKKYNSSATFVKVLEKFIEKGGKFSINTNNVAVHQQKIKTAFTTMRTSFTTKNNKIIINSTTDVTSGTGQSDASAEIHSTTFPGNETTNETVYFVYYKSSKLFAPSFQQVTVCQDGFTATNRRKITRRGPLYTVERVHKSLVTESSPVIASSLRGREVVNLSQPITIRFKLPPEMIEANHTKCVWWDFNAKGGLGDWSTEGCEFKRIINDTIECECNHMTNFAALVDVYGPSSKACGKHEFALSIIAYIGCGLSILGLALTIFTYGFFAKLRKEIAAKILLHLCTALLCVLIVFISGVEQAVKSKLNCQVVAVLMHYFLLVAFMWMFFEAYFMYFAFVKVWNDHGDYILLKCASIAWGLPGVVVTATILVDTENYGGEHYCRLKGLAFFLAFLAPVVSIIIFNTIIFSMIMYKLSVRPPARPADKDRGREGFLQLRRAFGILILVGLTWMFGFFAISDSRLIFTYTFSVLNCFQGFSIFMFYCVTQRNVRDSWMALLRCDLQSLNRKTVFTESYDPKTKTYLQDTGMRPRTRSEPTKNTFSTLQREKFRPRMHTADVKLPVRDKQTCKRETSSDNPNYEHSVADEHGTKYPQYVTVTIEPPPNDNASEEFEMTPIPGSKSGSLRSHKQESRDTVHSNQSTPKLFRMFKMGNSISAFSKAPQVGKNTLKRTASHTPEAPKQYTPVCLRRTQSAMSLGKENRISGDSLITYASTSSESLSTDSQSPRNGETRRLLTLSRLDPDNYGELIISSQRGSVRGIVGHVETSVDTYDDLIDELSDSEKKRSLSLPANAYSYIFDS